MKEIPRITIGLTISCLIAAVIMGSVFALTDKAKKHNEHVKVQETMVGLLGYGKGNPPPKELKLFSVFRYILEDAGTIRLGYMVPVAGKSKSSYELVVITPSGEFVERKPLDLSHEEANEASERESALKAVLRPSAVFSFADSVIVAVRGKDRLAYLLPSEFPGFKTFIKVIVALDPAFSVMGLEIMEHEEDPGLGAEIAQAYFKNQFRGKSFERLRDLKVTKDPLPEEYKKILEGKGTISREEIEALKLRYADKDIYAITGATISSRAVTSGVVNAAKKFSYRLKALERVMNQQQIAAAF